MAKYKFKDTEQLVFELLPEGNYTFKIMDAEEGIQSGGKTAGSDFIKITLAIGDKNGIRAQWPEKIIFHESLDWKTDQWLRCINFNDGKIGKGDLVDIKPETVVGCRGHAKIIVEKYKNNSGEEKEINKVALWLSDKGALPRDMELVKSRFAAQPDPFDTQTDDVPW